MIADWNGMAIRALAEAGAALDETPWIDAARRAFEFVTVNLSDDEGRLRHTWFGGKRGSAATLGDLAALSGAALTLFEITGEGAYLDRAAAWADEAVGDYWDDGDGGFFAMPAHGETLVIRTKPVIDDPNPSGNAQMVETLAQLYYLTGNAEYRAKAQATLKTFGGLVGNMAEDPDMGMAGFVNAADTLFTTLQVVIVGRRGETGTRALVRRTLGRSLPGRVLQVIRPGTVLPEGHPAQYKDQMDGLATAYVCRGSVCSLPATDAETLDRTLTVMRRGS